MYKEMFPVFLKYDLNVGSSLYRSTYMRRTEYGDRDLDEWEDIMRRHWKILQKRGVDISASVYVKVFCEFMVFRNEPMRIARARLNEMEGGTVPAG